MEALKPLSISSLPIVFPRAGDRYSLHIIISFQETVKRPDGSIPWVMIQLSLFLMYKYSEHTSPPMSLRSSGTRYNNFAFPTTEQTDGELETIGYPRPKARTTAFTCGELLTGAHPAGFRERGRPRHVRATTSSTAAWFYRTEAETVLSQLKLRELAGLLSI